MRGMKNKGASPSDFGHTRHHKAWVHYQRLLMEGDAMDYDDILLHARNLLQKDEGVRQRVCSIVKYMLVDEYQDSNLIQVRAPQLLVKYMV